MSSNKIYDPIRKIWVKSTPEACVRLNLLKKMVTELGYPLSLLTVEKELSKLPHITHEEALKIPKRRADIICFSKNIHPSFPLYPLLMIECKVAPLTPDFLWQLVGYNQSVKALFLAVSNENEIMTGLYNDNEGMFQFKAGLPSYEDLLTRVSVPLIESVLR